MGQGQKSPIGTPKYYSDRVFPNDTHCASQHWKPFVASPHGIRDRWRNGGQRLPSGLSPTCKAPMDTSISNVVHIGPTRPPTFHWGNETMLSGLATLLGRNDALL